MQVKPHIQPGAQEARNPPLKTRTLRGKGIRIELDSAEIFPEDPGQGTPVLVVLANGDSATWNCITETGETADGTQLTDDQKQWLESMTPTVEEWMRANNV
jgi:hypothetical protein